MLVLMCGGACVYAHIFEYILAPHPYDHSLSLGKSHNKIHQKNTKENVYYLTDLLRKQIADTMQQEFDIDSS